MIRQVKSRSEIDLRGRGPGLPVYGFWVHARNTAHVNCEASELKMGQKPKNGTKFEVHISKKIAKIANFQPRIGQTPQL